MNFFTRDIDAAFFNSSFLSLGDNVTRGFDNDVASFLHNSRLFRASLQDAVLGFLYAINFREDWIRGA